MADINTALDASKDAMEQLIIASERRRTDWTSPRAPGKWSPSQIVEHVARSLEESANMAAGRPSKFPKLPSVVLPIVRGLLFKRVLRNAAFPKAKTNNAMDPASGPATWSPSLGTRSYFYPCGRCSPYRRGSTCCPC